MCPAPRHTPQQQLDMILSAAVSVIEASSLLDFKMTSIAKEAGLSVGSLYKHVQSKEDLIILLACVLSEHIHGIMMTIYDAPLTMPQKLISFSLLDPKKSRLFSFDLDLEILSGSEPVLRRCSPMWKARFLSLESKISEMCVQKNLDCFESGEFIGDNIEDVHELNFGNWAMSIGFKQIHSYFDVLSLHTPAQSFGDGFDLGNSSIKAMMRFINAYPWRQPLTLEGIELTKQALIKLGYR
ncbi:TetR/AcrR family transcriptional regulator [Shewanella sp. SR44-3]|uniref:TetR/AcrR family transcriptional regulator n=1 Tax=unclassified Shewanella TaxID=196818 RepID=UPI0015FB35D1|nr:TetR/AcrR family transcriptional regulator [Shewanella sp. SR44-3]MBB1270865.1 TetR/AcrR family transcriptional regulator [Shewanella sp. SR44-3]